jgi:hypothetical protein
MPLTKRVTFVDPGVALMGSKRSSGSSVSNSLSEASTTWNLGTYGTTGTAASRIALPLFLNRYSSIPITA